MFAPMVIEGKAIGDFGLANKKTDFDDNDARLAQGFIEHAAIALQNSTNKAETRKAREILEKTVDQLQENEERFRSISTSVNDALITIDDKDCIIFWNQAAEKIFGYGSDEVLGQELHPLVTPERYWPAYREGFNQFKKTGAGNAIGRTLEVVAQRKDETEFPIELSLSSYSVKDKWYAVGTIRDISDRKFNEEKTAKLLADLQKSMKDVLNLSGLLPICSHCKKIRNDSGYWQRLETFIETHSEAVFSHSICKDCMELHYPEPESDEQQ
jgi:PAS domain S-box-containing protein